MEDIPPFCIQCGYNLTGSVSGRCPECGTPFVEKDWKREADRIREHLREARDCNEWVRRGLFVALAGLGCSVLVYVTGNACVKTLLVLGGVGCGISAVFLALGVFRVRRVPEWARERLGTAPNYSLAVLTVLLGVLAVAATAVLV